MTEFTIDFDNNSKEPLYLQMYNYIANEIKAGKIVENEKLPSKKSLSAHLRISQTTIENAYEMLVTEGYVRAIARSGYYVNRYEKIIVKKENKKNINIEKKIEKKYKYMLTTSGVDTESFPFSTWAKISKDVMYNNPQLLNIGENQGDIELREALMKYLHEFRGVNGSEKQIIIGAGMEYLIDLLCQILNEKYIFALENPCYTKNYYRIKNNGRKIVPIDVDENGMKIEEIEKENANIAYITPSHQFPMGATMPIGRRMALLNWASKDKDRYIIEDDYDSEFRFSGRPIPAIQGLDQNERVIYLGTFSRSIAPSIRIAYMMLPTALMKKYYDEFGYCSSTVSRFEQHTLAYFLKDGYYSRHLNRVRNLYKQRKEFIVKLVKKIFPKEKINIKGENLGLHFLIEINNDKNEKQLINEADKIGIKLRGLSEYYIKENKKENKPSIVIGYSGIKESDIEEAIIELNRVWF